MADWREETRRTSTATRGLGTRIGFGENPAVLVIDMTVAFTDPSYKVGCDQTATLDAIARLLESSRAKRVPTGSPRSPTARRQGRRHVRAQGPCSPRAPGRRPEGHDRVDPRIAPVEGEVVDQQEVASAFFEHGARLACSSRAGSTR